MMGRALEGYESCSGEALVGEGGLVDSSRVVERLEEIQRLCLVDT